VARRKMRPPLRTRRDECRLCIQDLHLFGFEAEGRAVHAVA
jgi:hypothetical protein